MRNQLFRERRGAVWATAVPAVVALLLYAPTLRLPLIYDTLLHIRIAESLNFVTVWLPTEAFGFYRPLTFLPFLIIKGLFGYYPGWLLHGLNVGQHALNAALLAGLVWRLWRQWDRALVAGLLFAVFPFSYQAVAVYGHNVHPATAGLILLGLHGYWGAMSREPDLRRTKMGWWWLAGVCFSLALLSHESAVLFGAFAALMQLSARDEPFSVQKFLQSMMTNPKSLLQRHPWLLFLATGAAYIVVYQFLPISRAPQATPTGSGEAWQRIIYLLQAGSYPLSWFGSVVAATAVTLLLIALAVRQKKNRGWLLLGWGWWALASLLIAIPLPTTYLLHGPRLLYLSSVGLAIAWSSIGMSPHTPFRIGDWQSGIGQIVGVVCVGFVLVVNGWFVNGRLQAYQQLTAPVQVMADVMVDQPDDAAILLINLPDWLAPAVNTYPVGVEFVSMLGDYLFVEELVAANVRRDYVVTAVQLPELLNNPAYSYGLHQPQDWSEVDYSIDQHLFLTRYGDAGMTGQYQGVIHSGGSQAPPMVQFDTYQLLSWQSDACGENANLQLVWQPVASMMLRPTISIFVQLFNTEGQLLGQVDGPPLGLRPDLLPVTREGNGRTVTDRRQLPVPSRQAAYWLIGVYDFATGVRETAVSANGVAIPNNAYRIDLSDCESP